MPDPTPTLTDEQQRYQIAAAADHGPETCDCDAYAPENGYPDNLICDALVDTFAVAARMVADAEQWGRAEVSAAVEDVAYLGTSGRWIITDADLRGALTDPAAAVARIKAEVLREAADKWQTGAWTVLTAPIKAPTQPQRILGAAQAVTDWLRDRADRIGGQP